MSEGIEMFILRATRVPNNLLKVEMIIYIGKWNVCPDRNQGNKIIIVFRGTDAVHLLEGENQSVSARKRPGVRGNCAENDTDSLQGYL